MPAAEEQRAALARWLEQERPALERRDWTAAFKTYPRLNLAAEAMPWAAFDGAAAPARLALVSSGGVYIDGEQEPFEAADPYGDYSWRSIPLDTAPGCLALAHDHYDHAAAWQDINTVYPLERLRDLIRAGDLGGVVDPAFSFMGYQPDWTVVQDTLAPSLADAVAAQRPDAALLVPV